LKAWNALQYERVGLNLRPELVALKDVNGDGVAFAALAKLIAETSEFNLILMSESADIIEWCSEATAGFKRPLIYAATAANVDAFGKIALDNDLPLVVKADSIDGLIALTDKLVPLWASRIWCSIPVPGKSSRPWRIRWPSDAPPSRPATVRWVFRPSPSPARWPRTSPARA
jgi:hypothetical protein